jgi:hypothetical protein
MSSEYDQAIFTESVQSELDPHYFTSKDILWTPDLNGSQYSGGVINIDTSSLSSSGKWLAYSEAEIVIPFTILMQSSVDISANANSYMAGLKSGHWNLINSMSVSYNGTQLIDQQSNLNMFVNYKVLSEWDMNTLRKYGSILGLPEIDTPTSFSYSAVASNGGVGISNNTVVGADQTFGTLETSNSGFLQRLYNNALSPVTGLNSLPIYGAANQTIYPKAVDQPFYQTSGAAAARIYQWHVVAVIRLKDIADLFDKMPLVKKGLFRFQINYNALQSATITTALTAGPPATSTLISSTPSVIGATNPVMVASGATGNPMAANASGTVSIASGVGGATIGSTTIKNELMDACRLYVPAYTVAPEYEAQLLESAGVKDIEYADIYSYYVPNVGPGSNFNTILSNSAKNPKKVVVIPQINSTSNAGVRPMLSLFDTSPFTTCPFASISNFQVQVSGNNIYNSAVQYDFDMFLNEVGPGGALFGGVSSKDSSGLLSYRAWTSGYRYYVTDVSRRLPEGDFVDKSIVISGVNNTAVTMDYYTFVTLGRKIRLNIVDGSVQKLL